MQTNAPSPEAEAARNWNELFAQVPEEIRSTLAKIVLTYREPIAMAFYERMMSDAEVRSFLTHDAVEKRLKHSMQRWLETLFTCNDARQFGVAMALQRHVGEVHARIDLPVNLVARGARVLKERISDYLLETGLDPRALVVAVRHADTLIDLAFEEMSAAYVVSHARAARIDEAYRVFSYGHNLSLERERQRAALLDWENHFLQDMMVGAEGDVLPQLAESSFGLWLQHKAHAIFEGCPEMPAILRAIRNVDENLIPLCGAQLGRNERDETRRLMQAAQAELREIKFLLDAVFERFLDLESGKDALTQLLNRRFLPAILGREAELSRKQGKRFALLLLDIDHFKSINDRHGHEAGDRVLQQIAALLLNSVRAGDFVFRYGGEEFLIVLVESDGTHALRVAEKIRQRIESEAFLLAGEQHLRVSTSIGVALDDGHPDYQRLIEQADRALYRAKHGGRNRCVLGDE